MEPSSLPPTKILVMRLSSMGDIVLTTPVLRALKSQLEGEVEVHFLCKQNFADLLKANPYLYRIHTFDRTVQEVLPQLVEQDFDYVIDLHKNIRTSVVKRRLKKLQFDFDKLNFKKWLWVNFGFNFMPPLHIVDRYMATLKAFGIKDDGLGLDYHIPVGEGLTEAFLQQLPSQHFLVVVIGAAHTGKRADAEVWKQWLQSIHYPIVLIGGKEDMDAAQQIAHSSQAINLVGQLSIHQSADVIARSHVVVTGDTGMMHIAAAFGKRIISIWGCTAPGLGMGPYRAHPGSISIEPQLRKKRPCSKLGNRCKYGLNNRCMHQNSASQIRAAIEKSWVQ
jgi:ADP-heptose:LPS heptosyltransferase